MVLFVKGLSGGALPWYTLPSMEALWVAAARLEFAAAAAASRLSRDCRATPMVNCGRAERCFKEAEEGG